MRPVSTVNVLWELQIMYKHLVMIQPMTYIHVRQWKESAGITLNHLFSTVGSYGLTVQHIYKIVQSYLYS